MEIKPSLKRCFINGLGQGTSASIVLPIVLYIIYKLNEIHLYQLIDHLIGRI